ncbi:uncharacterized protein AC631_04724 [Debaryomyces fabryi]|uniref:Uncharacterized protein n=1 Tax=Debaryomyces fabryi TaxID=58627 RepID=A0A0V1PTM3_9ASCO|nr:uncharacterized protein AC631_04724 [Debaryomyces fabryi]KRZ99505.1 hypothetical protein AC631_04724 [Debaryomyces fabryi]CUM45380.1 unnamed protein product [Debaryomyces fabryi]
MIYRRGSKVLLRHSFLKYNLCNKQYVSSLRNIKLESPVPSLTAPPLFCNLNIFKPTNVENHAKIKFTGSSPVRSDLSSEDLKPNPKDQLKKANLGSMTDELRALIPNILNKSLPKKIISNSVHLRICPTHFQEFNAYFPTLKGHVSYYTTCKTLQFILTSIVLNPKVKLHIQSIKTSAAKSDLGPEMQGVYPHSTKIYVRWNTCLEGCDHLSPNEISEDRDSNDTSNYHSTSDAKLGSHKWSKFDTQKLVNNSNEQSIKSSPSVTATLSHLTTGLIGLTKEHNRLERVISGIFIFELNENNDKIIVHTVEDVNVIEKTETQDIDGELRVC